MVKLAGNPQLYATVEVTMKVSIWIGPEQGPDVLKTVSTFSSDPGLSRSIEVDSLWHGKTQSIIHIDDITKRLSELVQAQADLHL